MKDEDRIREGLDAIGNDDAATRQLVKQLVKAARFDENAACESLAFENESRKTAEAIRQRRENPNACYIPCAFPITIDTAKFLENLREITEAMEKAAEKLPDLIAQAV